MNLQESIRRILREERATSTYIKRRMRCFEDFINKLMSGEIDEPISRRRYNRTTFRIVLSMYMTDYCDNGGGDNRYDPIITDEIMELHGEKLYKWYLNQLKKTFLNEKIIDFSSNFDIDNVESLKLVHKGTGKYIYESVMKGGVDLPSKFLRRFRVFRDAVLNTDAVLNPCEYDSFNHFKSSIYQNVSEMVDEGYFNNKPVSEWLSYELGVLYIEQYMMDDLKEYYYVECVE